MPDTSRSFRFSFRIGWKRVLLLLYLIALLASTIVRMFQPDFHPRPDQTTLTLRAVDGENVLQRTISLSYVDSAPGDTLNRPVIVLLHGSPASSSSMMGMHRALAASDSFRVITPDMPGFAGSSHSIPDYSVRAHARYLLELLDSLQVARAHLVAYSMSGGTVLETYDIAPDRVASITMLSAIGVQEMELMGDYLMNHAVHGLQLAGIWLLQEAFPHFGWMDRAFLNLSYARNFYDTDQRPLRGILLRYAGPMQIIHAKDDPLVPYAAALEHHRLVPQSTLYSFETGDHGMPFRTPDTLATLVGRFVQQVEQGTAPDRSEASPERIARSKMPFDASSIPPAKDFALVVLVVLIIAATLVSEDLACIGAGLMAARGTLTFGTAFSAAFAGIVIGDILLYALGRTLGTRIVRRAPFRWFIRNDQLERGEAWFERSGIRVIFASRFIPGTRLPTYVAAGVLKTPFWKFLFYFLLAGILWAPLIVGLSTFLGNRILSFYEVYDTFAIWVLFGTVLLLYAVIHVAIPAFSHYGRRRILGRYRRLTKWEFWPAPVFYLPVVCYVLGLAVRFRSLTLFTAANPGIPDGGFVGESKSDILDRLSGVDTLVARYERIDNPADGAARTIEFMSRLDLDFPIVLKPDAGERGAGVRIVYREEELREWFNGQTGPSLIQEFAPGHEFGVFYYRYPGEESGHIFSITDKRLLFLEGDGERTLEHLILDDERAVSMANTHFREHASELEEIPDAGRVIELVSVGTHCRGALFLDGGHLETEALRQTIDRISLRMDGFYFGRYDIRTPDTETFRSGQNFKILELNGVTSEATHIYDPSGSLFDAYRTLFKQWHIAFEIGNLNRNSGVEPSSVFRLIRLILSRMDSKR